jgi:hypothetical protein
MLTWRNVIVSLGASDSLLGLTKGISVEEELHLLICNQFLDKANGLDFPAGRGFFLVVVEHCFTV